MDIDDNSVYEDNTYFIRSLYFDDINNSSYHEKLDGIENREKYRIRIYNMDDSFIRLERKEKKRNLIHKIQVPISKELCQQIIDRTYDKELIKEETHLGDIIRDIEFKHLVPSVIVDYRRLAYIYPAEDTRITFDENVSSGRYESDIFRDDIVTSPTFDERETVLEIKFNNHLPNHIYKIVTSLPMVRRAISKFALCYEKKEV